MAEVHTSETLTRSAPLEPVLSAELPYSHMIELRMVQDSFDGPIDQALASFLQGMGKVDLIKIEASIRYPTADLWVKIGFTHPQSGWTVDDTYIKPNGYYGGSNAFTANRVDNIVLVPEDTLSRQLRPVSGELPMIQLQIAKAAGAAVFIFFYIKVRGLVQLKGNFQ